MVTGRLRTLSKPVLVSAQACSIRNRQNTHRHPVFFSGTHCLEPYPPPDSTGLIPNRGYGGDVIDFTTEFLYECDRRMHFENNFDQTDVNATCKTDNQWDLPCAGSCWGQCTDSK